MDTYDSFEHQELTEFVKTQEFIGFLDSMYDYYNVKIVFKESELLLSDSPCERTKIQFEIIKYRNIVLSTLL